MKTKAACAAYLAVFCGLLVVSDLICLKGAPFMPWYPLFGAWADGHTLALFGAYLAAVAALYGLYFFLLSRFRKGGPEIGKDLRAAALIGTLLHVALLCSSPSRSVDVYTYLAHGYNTSQDYRTAYTAPAYGVTGTPYGDALKAVGREIPKGHGPNPYGPIWVYFEGAVVAATGLNLHAGELLVKAGLAAANLGSAALVWGILNVAAPEAAALGAIAYLYNPFLCAELVGEGHLDAWMIFFVLAAVHQLVRKKTRAAMFLLSLAVLTKWIPLILAPAFLRCASREDRDWFKNSAAGLGGGGVLGLILMAPVWRGSASTGGIQNLLSDSALLRLLTPILATVHIELSLHVYLALAAAVYLAFYLRESWRAADFSALCESCAGIILAYFMIFPVYFWNWYAAFPAALLLVSRGRRAFALAAVLSIVASINSPLWEFAWHHRDYFVDPQSVTRMQDLTTLGVLIPSFLAFLFLRREEEKTRWRIMR